MLETTVESVTSESVRGERSTTYRRARTARPALGAYMRGPDGIRHGTGPIVLMLTGERISAATRFESSVLPWFGLPRNLPD
jgi:RNA polymerase sigma-70 factor (ECF subfamily)